jgi:hypothetical protein
MRFARDGVRDHIVCLKNDYEPSYALYGASQRWKSLKIDFREIFGVDRFWTFATPSCGGLAPTAERTVGPARTIVGELDTQTRN